MICQFDMLPEKRHHVNIETFYVINVINVKKDINIVNLINVPHHEAHVVCLAICIR